MGRNQGKRPFYRRPWLWVIVAVLLIGGGLLVSRQNQVEETQDDTVVKTTKKPEAKKKSTKDAKKESTKKARPSESKAGQAANNAGQQNQQPASGDDTANYAGGSSQVTAPSTGNSNNGMEPWVDPDNYEPNSIIGDRATMHCYLPGQYPYPGIAPENVVYFNSLAEARAAGYNTVQ